MQEALTGPKLGRVVLYSSEVQVVVSPLNVFIHVVVVATSLLQAAVALESASGQPSEYILDPSSISFQVLDRGQRNHLATLAPSFCLAGRDSLLGFKQQYTGTLL